MSETKRNHPRRIQEFADEIARLADEIDEAGAAIPAKLDAGPFTRVVGQTAHDVARDTAELVIQLRAASTFAADRARTYALVDAISLDLLANVQRQLDDWEKKVGGKRG